MSLKDLFGKNTEKIVSNKDLKELQDQVESEGFLQENIKDKERFLPAIDFSSSSNFAKYGLAEKYYNDAFENIYNFYPYDGSLKEKQQWLNTLTQFDLYVYNNIYPKTTGFINLGSGSVGSLTTASVSYRYSGSPQYVVIKGGPNASPTGKFNDSNIYNVDANRESNLALTENGNTVEFWFKDNVETSNAYTNNAYCLFDLWNANVSGSHNYTRLTIENSSSNFYVTYASGSTGVQQKALNYSIDKANWHHYAFVFANNSNNITISLYVDGEHADSVSSTLPNSIALANNKGNIANIGSFRTNKQATEATSWNGIGNCFGSIDEFRFWKSTRTARQIYRNYFTHVNGGSNTDDSNTNLGVYYKFNEGIISPNEINAADAICLDYSGRISNGTIKNYALNVRSTGSAIDTFFEETKEPKDVIVIATNSLVSSTLDNYLQEAKDYDQENSSNIYRSLPAWITEEDENIDGKELKNLIQTISSYFDTLHLQIEALSKLGNIEYYDQNSKPKPFIDKILSSYNFDNLEIFNDTTFIEDILSRNETKEFDKKINDIKNVIYQNIYNNLAYIYKSKGTEKSLRNLIRCFGVDDELIKINLYASNSTYEFNEKYKYVSTLKKFVDFNDPNRYVGTVIQKKIIDNDDSRGYIAGKPSSIQDYSPSVVDYLPLTLQSEIIFPKKVEFGNEKYDIPTFSEVSLFGVHTANNKDADLTWGTDPFNFHVLAVKRNFDSSDVYFKFTGSLAGYGFNVTSSWYKETYNNEKWNLAVRLKPQKYALSNVVSGSSTGDFLIELLGYNSSLDVIQNSFIFSQSIPEANAKTALLNDKRVFAGAHYSNFNTSSILHKTDVKISSVRYWLDYLTDEEIKVHSFDVTNYGRLNPDWKPDYSFSIFNSSSIFTKSDTLLLNWDFSNVSSSDENGEFIVYDLSSGSNQTALNSKYGILGQICKYHHGGFGTSFYENDTQVINKEYIHSAKQLQPEVMAYSDTITTPDTDDVTRTKDSRPVSYYISIEKSMAQVINDQMINWFATIKDFNNLIGDPSERYRKEYKGLQHLRKIYFQNVKNTPDFEKFITFYKWIDSSISTMISQLIPASANVSNKVRNIVESHLLERSKYENKLPTLELKGEPVTSLSSFLEYKYEDQAAPGVITNSGSVLWIKERAERSAEVFANPSVSVESQEIRDAANFNTLNKLPTLYSADTLQNYVGKRDQIRKFNKPYKIETSKPLILEAVIRPARISNEQFTGRYIFAEELDSGSSNDIFNTPKNGCSVNIKVDLPEEYNKFEPPACRPQAGGFSPGNYFNEREIVFANGKTNFSRNVDLLTPAETIINTISGTVLSQSITDYIGQYTFGPSDYTIRDYSGTSSQPNAYLLKQNWFLPKLFFDPVQVDEDDAFTFLSINPSGTFMLAGAKRVDRHGGIVNFLDSSTNYLYNHAVPSVFYYFSSGSSGWKVHETASQAIYLNPDAPPTASFGGPVANFNNLKVKIVQRDVNLMSFTTYDFSASVTNTITNTTNSLVYWELDTGSVGSISSTGLYTANVITGMAKVIARSVEDPTVYDSVYVKVAEFSMKIYDAKMSYDATKICVVHDNILLSRSIGQEPVNGYIDYGPSVTLLTGSPSTGYGQAKTFTRNDYNLYPSGSNYGGDLHSVPKISFYNDTFFVQAENYTTAFRSSLYMSNSGGVTGFVLKPGPIEESNVWKYHTGWNNIGYSLSGSSFKGDKVEHRSGDPLLTGFQNTRWFYVNASYDTLYWSSPNFTDVVTFGLPITLTNVHYPKEQIDSGGTPFLDYFHYIKSNFAVDEKGEIFVFGQPNIFRIKPGSFNTLEQYNNSDRGGDAVGAAVICKLFPPRPLLSNDFGFPIDSGVVPADPVELSEDEVIEISTDRRSQPLVIKRSECINNVRPTRSGVNRTGPPINSELFFDIIGGTETGIAKVGFLDIETQTIHRIDQYELKKPEIIYTLHPEDLIEEYGLSSNLLRTRYSNFGSSVAVSPNGKYIAISQIGFAGQKSWPIGPGHGGGNGLIWIFFLKDNLDPFTKPELTLIDVYAGYLFYTHFDSFLGYEIKILNDGTLYAIQPNGDFASDMRVESADYEGGVPAIFRNAGSVGIISPEERNQVLPVTSTTFEFIDAVYVTNSYSNNIFEIFNSYGSAGGRVAATGEGGSGYLFDRDVGGYSVDATINYRNIRTRAALNTWLAESSSIDTQYPSYHKTPKNPAYLATKTQYDNAFITHQIPRSDTQYAWITASIISKPQFSGYITQYSNLNAYNSSSFQLLSGTVSGSTVLDYVGLNVDTIKNVNTFSNTISPLYNLTASDETNKYISNLNGPYQYPSWKQIRNADNKLVIETRKNNIYTVRDLPVVKFRVDENNKLVSYVDKNDGSFTSFKEPPVTYNFPMEHLLNVTGSRDSISVISSYDNNKKKLSNTNLANRLGIKEKDDAQAHDILVDLEDGLYYPKPEIINVKYTTNIFPSDLNVGIKEIRNKPNYEEANPTGLALEGRSRNIATIRSFWNNRIEDRARKSNAIKSSNFFEKLTTGFTLLNSSFRIGWPDATIPTNSHLFKLNLTKSNSDSFDTIWSLDNNLYYTYNSSSALSPLASNIITSSLYLSSSYISELAGHDDWFELRNMLKKPIGGNYGYRRIDESSASINNYEFFDIASAAANELVPLPKPSLIYKLHIPSTLYYGFTRSFEYYISTYTFINKGYVFTTPEISGKYPWFNNYEEYFADIKPHSKNYSLLPEYKISDHMEYFIKEKNGDFNSIITSSYLTLDGVNYDYNTITSSYNITNNLDTFIFDDINSSNKSIKITINGIMKLLPYKGFYPNERAVQLVDLFQKSFFGFENPFNYLPVGSVFFDTNDLTKYATSDQGWLGERFLQSTPIFQQMQTVFQTMFAPGILFNTIKSGIAVDWPVVVLNNNELNYNSSFDETLYSSGSVPQTPINSALFTIGREPTTRMDFESIIDFKKSFDNITYKSLFYLDPSRLSIDMFSGSDRNLIKNPNYNLFNEARPNKDSSYLDNRYKLAINNYLAEIPNFFLVNSSLTTFISRPSKTFKNLYPGKRYEMLIKLSKDKNLKMVVGNSNIFSSIKNDFYTINFDDTRGFQNILIPEASCFGPPYKISNTIFFSYTNHTFYNDPAYAPYVPPYYYGERTLKAYLDVPDSEVPRRWELEEILANLDFEESFPELEDIFLSSSVAMSGGTATQNALVDGYLTVQELQNVYRNSPAYKGIMPMSASLNLLGKTNTKLVTYDEKGNIQSISDAENATDGDSWVIQPKFESPVLDFNNINNINSINAQKTLVVKTSNIPTDHTWTNSNVTTGFTGMWSGYGNIPTDNKGIKLSISNTIPSNSKLTKSLAGIVGFETVEKKIGQLASTKEISEAILLIPYTNNFNDNDKTEYATTIPAIFGENGFTENKTDVFNPSIFGTGLKKKIKILPSKQNYPFYFKVNLSTINKILDINFDDLRLDKSQIIKNTNNTLKDERYANNTILKTIKLMSEYNLPTHLDWVTNRKINPFVMYIVEFKHTLEQQDLSDIWQGVMPRIAKQAQLKDAELTHDFGPDEFFHGKKLPPDIKWKIFKVKKKANINYYSLTADNADDEKFKFKFNNSSTEVVPDYSYNWPYDFFSLVELANVNIELESDRQKNIESDRKILLDDIAKARFALPKGLSNKKELFKTIAGLQEVARRAFNSLPNRIVTDPARGNFTNIARTIFREKTSAVINRAINIGANNAPQTNNNPGSSFGIGRIR